MATQQIREKITESDAHNQSPLSAYPAAYTKAKTIFAVSAEVRAPLVSHGNFDWWIYFVTWGSGFCLWQVCFIISRITVLPVTSSYQLSDITAKRNKSLMQKYPYKLHHSFWNIFLE